MRVPRSLTAVVAVIALFVPVRGFAAPPLVITTLSTAPDRVSGGDVLVRIGVPAGADLSSIVVALNDQDVTGAFRPDGVGHALLGLVIGLM
jgi:hypothetical protein